MLTEPVLASHPAFAKQVELEKQAVVEGASRYRKQIAAATRRGEGARVHAVEHTRAHWFHAVRAVIVREKIACRQHPERYKRPAYAKQLLELKSSVLAAITIDAGLSKILQHDGEVTWTRFSYAIGTAVVAEVNNGKARKARSLQKLRASAKRLTPQRVTKWAKYNLDDPESSKAFALAVGDFLGLAMVTAATVEDREGKLYPAFRRYRIRRPGMKYKAWHVRLSDEATRTIASWHSAIQRQRPAHMPMLVEPMPWQESRTPLGKKIEGGRITANYPLVSKATRQQKDAYQQADLTRTFDGIAAISATPGRVDVNVAAVIDHVAVDGGKLSVPPANDDPAPVRPETEDADQLAAWKAERSAWYRKTIALASERENFAHSLTAMRTMRSLAGDGFDRFWFDYFLDYRGRAYARSSCYCPQERDIWRASIQLADAKEPGDEGMRAIRRYAASLYGMDKASLVDRETWTLDHMSQIRATAADPMSNYGFWSQADKGENAWQFLQACYALCDAEAAAHFAIGLDGTSNGLQHYTAMSLDDDAAGLVNMLESGEGDRPGDPYGVIAQQVGMDVAIDAATNPIAQLVSGRVTRGVVKQPVMTTVYGVTPAGMREQLTWQLEFIEDRKLRWQAAKYLQGKIAAALAGQFPRAVALMAWFRDVADAFSERGKLMRWTTPLGFPVVSRHVSTKTTAVKLATGTYDLRIADPDAGVRVKKQRDSSAPGVVHSIDAADMFLKGIRARQLDLSFWPNHDCFRTHAANWGALNAVVRDTFIDLHSANLPLKLYDEWRGMGLDIEPPPPTGTLDLGRVRGSRYFVN